MLARRRARGYARSVLRPVRLLLAALALLALSPETARADEPSHGPAKKTRTHHRRAQAQKPAGRAPRGGAAPALAKAKRPPAEKAESIGSPNDGHLKGGAHLDMSKPYLRTVPVYESGDVRWGLPIMVNVIDRAARIVARRFPGAALDVGDLSQKGGGDVLRHHSHESGRDADLGFYALDAKGKQIHGRTFVKFDPNLTSPNYPGARFDLARNWAFVQELLTDPAARVSHVFIADWLKRELLAYARPRVSRALLDRAALVLMQPTNSLPHDDHFHVRISCPRDAHTCVELARNAPHGKPRVARRTSGGAHPLKTPHGHGRGAHTPAGHRPHKPPPASAVAPQDPFALPAMTPPADEPDDRHEIED